MTAGRALWMSAMGRDEAEWELLQPLTRDVWERRAAGDLSFVASDSFYMAQKPDEPEPDPIPAPEVPARLVDIKDPGIPRGARTVINRFLKNGWDVDVSYARGPWVQVRDWHVVDSYLVRARYGKTRVAAIWVRKEWLEKETIEQDVVVPAKPHWSNELMRVNDNQGYPLKADELKDLTLAAQYARVTEELTPSNEGEL